MKRLITLLFVLMLTVVSVFAQAPQKMSYQAVVRNANNTLVTNQNVSVRISVLQGSATGSAVYVETHNVQTNANGLMTVEVGTGLPTNGSFDQINWGQGPFYLKSEIDPEGGINYSIEGVQQLLSVPYALYAAKAGNVPSVAVVPTANGYDIVFNGQTFHIENCTSPTVTANQNPTTGDVTLTINNNDGSTPTTMTIPAGQDGQDGAQGPAGQNGTSPTVTTTQDPTTGDVTLTINNNDGTTPTTVTIPAGQDGQDGAQGPAGQNGTSPTVTTTQNPNTGDVTVTINNNDGTTPTTVTIPAGQDGPQGPIGPQGPVGPQGEQGVAGVNGQDGISPTITTNPTPNGTEVTITDANGTHQFTIPNGEQGPQGEQGVAGVNGQDGISPTITTNPTPNGTEVTITDANGTHQFTIPNGQQGPQGEQGVAGVNGQDGISPTITTNPTPNGTEVTITDANGTHQFTIPNGQQGPQGEQGVAGVNGQDGVSPIITTNPTPNGTEVTITDASGTHQFTIPNGEQGPAGPQGEQGPQGETGPQGPAGQDGATAEEVAQELISNPTYVSVLQGEQGPAGPQGETGPQGPAGQDGATAEEVAQELISNPTYVSALQGEQGPAGPQGETGPQGPAGQDGATAEEVAQELISNPTYASVLQGEQGPAGPQGEQGPQGETGPQGPAGQDGVSPTITTNPTENGTEVTITDANGTYQVVIPNGEQGPQGEPGEPGASPTITVNPTPNNDGYVINITDVDGDTQSVTVTNGQDMNSIIPPIVLTKGVTLTDETARLKGYISYYGNDSTYSVGMEWGTDPDSLVSRIENTDLPVSTPNSVFAITVANVMPSTTYYFRAYGRNGGGTTYGEIMSFTTPSTFVEAQPCQDAPTVTDIDGNVYNTVQIGNQCWMKENMRTTRFPSGAPIPNPSSYVIPGYQTNNGNYYYNAHAALLGQRTTVENNQGVCPDGWHIPSIDDWIELAVVPTEELFVNGNNHSGFSALALGYFISSNYYAGIADFATSKVEAFSAADDDVFYSYNLYNPDFGNSSYGYSRYGTRYVSVRCIRGNGITFPPTVVLNEVTEIMSSEALGEWTVVTDGGSPVTQQGLCWNTTGNPTVADQVSTGVDTELGNHNFTMTGLLPQTTYYVRAFATNANGITYSDSVMVFTTTVLMNRPCPDAPTVTDYDGNVYNTVQIGDQCWMKENLKTTHYATGAELTEYNSNNNIRSQYYPKYFSGDNGYYYDYMGMMNGNDRAVGNQGICPDGWHIPAFTEYTELFNALGGQNVAYDKIMATRSNESGLSFRLDGGYFLNGYRGDFMILRSSNANHQYKISDNNITALGGDAYYSPVRCIKNTGAAVTGLPTIVIDDTVRNLTSISNDPGAYIVYDGGKSITEFGWQYGVSTSDLTTDRFPNQINSVCPLPFGSRVQTLQPNTTYYLRGFATNENGTAYTDFVTFTTPIMMNQPCPDAPTVTDYDGNVYQTVQIGEQCWMKENLRTTHYITGSTMFGINQEEFMPRHYVVGNNVLYSQQAAINNSTQGICPQGWRLPTRDEYLTLFNVLGGMEAAFPKLITTGDWNVPNATNESGFSLPYVPNRYYSYHYQTLSTETAVSLLTASEYCTIDLENSGISLRGGNAYFNSVRCIKGEGSTGLPKIRLDKVKARGANEGEYRAYISSDGSSPILSSGIEYGTSPNNLSNRNDSGPTHITIYSQNFRGLEPNTTYYVRAFATNANGTAYSDSILSFTTPIIMNVPCSDAPTVTDYDGNVYQTVQVGEQCWMKENLKTTHYATGAELTEYNSNNNIRSQYYPKYFSGDNGYYYDYMGMMNGNDRAVGNQGICPDGWHIPAFTEYTELFNALGGQNVAYDKIMATRSNESGLSFRLDGGYFLNGYHGDFMILRSSNASHQYKISDNNITALGGDAYYSPVRCIKNTGAAVTGLPTIFISDTVRYMTSVSNSPGAYVVYDGGKSITQLGWQYGVSTSDLTTDSFSNLNNYECPLPYGSEVQPLQPNTTYYLRGFATNENGTAYTDFVTFTTPAMMNLPCPDAATVSDYDGNVYNTVMIGNQCWTKEDMKTTHYATGRQIENSVRNFGRLPGYYNYGNDNGKLYDYWTITNGFTNYSERSPIQGICPNGWHVPSFAEIQELINTLGGLSQAESKLKYTTGWNIPGTNESGFTAYPAGYYRHNQSQYYGNEYLMKSADFTYALGITNEYGLGYIGENQEFASARCVKGQGIATEPVLDSVSISEVTPEGAYAYVMIDFDGNSTITELGICMGTSQNPTQEEDYTNNSTDNAYFRLTTLEPNTTYYIRAYAKYGNNSIAYGPDCSFTTPAVVMNTACPDAPMVSDIDGNWYNTVQIGNQCWMKENLRTTTFANGEAISSDTMNAKFYTLPTNSGYMAARYGLFYSWDAIMNGAPGNYGAPVQGICPSGWHVPSKNEWIELNNNLQGGFNSATAIMLRENSNFWNDGGGNNKTGMSIRPAGYLGYYNNTSTQFGSRTEFYTADMSNADNVFYVYFSDNYYNIASQSPNEYLSSVRCIKGEGATVFPPRIEIIGYTPHTYNTATIEVKVINNGGGITRYGIYITDNPNEHLYFAQYASHQYGTNNIQSGETFSFTMNGVVPFNDDRVKYAVAYAINEMDTVYSEPMQIVIMNVPCQTSTVTDASGNSYNTVQIDKQCWMKENLRTTKYPSGANIETCDGSNTRYYKHVNNSANNDAVYGLHYTWAAAMNGAPGSYNQPVQGICPAGWHIPTRAEFETLKATVNGDMNALKNTQYWSSTGTTNTSGFSLNPSGYTSYSCSSTSSASIGSSSELMTADQSSSNNYYYFNASGNFSSNGKTSYMDAVRCIKGEGVNVFTPEVQTLGFSQNTYNSVKVSGKIVADNGAVTSKGICYSTTNSMPTISDSKVTSSANTAEYTCTLTGLTPAKTYFVRAFVTNSAGTAYGSVDTIKIMNVSCSSSSVSYSGHSYPTVQIGGQCWLKENLRTTKYTTGYDLYYADNFEGTYYSDRYSYVYWNHSSNNASRGLLYGRDHAGIPYFSTSTSNQSGLRGLCPTGWHIPSKAEVNELTSFLGGSYVAGGKLKSTTGWTTPGTNESGFNMTPTGYFQSSTSTFQYGTTNAYFWVTDGQGNTYAAAGCANNNNIVNFYNREAADQVPIRCLKDGATFSNISGVQISGPSNSYNYRVTASFNKSSANSSYGNSSVVECGIEGQNGQKITSSSTSSINVTVSFPGSDSGFPYRCYIKTADGKYYYSESQFLEGFIVN